MRGCVLPAGSADTAMRGCVLPAGIADTAGSADAAGVIVEQLAQRSARFAAV